MHIVTGANACKWSIPLDLVSRLKEVISYIELKRTYYLKVYINFPTYFLATFETAAWKTKSFIFQESDMFVPCLQNFYEERFATYPFQDHILHFYIFKPYYYIYNFILPFDCTFKKVGK